MNFRNEFWKLVSAYNSAYMVLDLLSWSLYSGTCVVNEIYKNECVFMIHAG